MRKFSLFLIFGIIAFIALALFWPEKAYTPHKVSENYKAQADAYNIPPMPADWQWKRFPTSDGTALRWGETGNRMTAETTLMIIPGYTATVSMYGEHIDLLAERGFHVIGLDLRGQGGSDRHFENQPEKLWVEDFSTYSADVKEFVDSQNFPNTQNIIPLAISFGGHVALRTAGEYPDVFHALALLAPAIEPKAGDMAFDKALGLMNTMRKIGKAKRYVPGNTHWVPAGEDYSVAGIELCSSNPNRLYLRDAIFTREPAQRVGGVTNQWGAEFFESSEFIRQDGFMQAIDIPIYIASAEQDDFVVTETNHKVCDQNLPNCRYVTYEGTGHCLPQESDAVINAMFDEIKKLAEVIEK